MDRSNEYNLRMSRRSRDRRRNHEPNMSVKSGTYQIHLSIPKSMLPGNISIKAANSRARPLSPFERRPLSPRAQQAKSPVEHAYKPTSPFENHSASLSQPAPPTRPSMFSVSLPMENITPRSAQNGHALTVIPDPSELPPSPRQIPNGHVVTPRSNINGHTISSKVPPPLDLSSLANQRSPNGVKKHYDPRSPTVSQNFYRVGSRSAKDTVNRSKSFTAKHYIQKSERKSSNTLPRSTSPFNFTSTNGTFPRSMSPTASTPRSPVNESPRPKSHVAMVTPSVFDDSMTARSVLETSVTSQSSFRANMYETYRDLCRQNDMMFKDPDFPAMDESLFRQGKSPVGQIQWKRPGHLCKKPRFLSNDITSCKIQSGQLGSNWLIGCFTCLTSAPSLMKHCIPVGQEFDDKYVGIFRFRFWRFGQWTEIVIDDRLPTLNGELLYSRSSDPTEFWPALFEKAYAKLQGCYEVFQGGVLGWSLQDITGGITMTTNIQDNPKFVQKVVDIGLSRASLIGASIQITTNVKAQTSPAGLVTGHVYNVTGYAELPKKSETEVLVRLRDCSGKSNWRGAWSEGSKDWSELSDDVRAQVRNRKMENGEFWMSFEDFNRTFTLLESCFLTPESWKLEPKIQYRKSWRSTQAPRQWRFGFNAGGPHDSPMAFSNCQFFMELKKPSCVVLSILQKYRSTVNRVLSIGCLVYSVPNALETRLGYSEFNQLKLLFSTGLRQNRENAGFYILPAGHYLVLPVTANPEMEGKFMLRIFTEGDSSVRELDEQDKAIPYQYDRKLDTTSLYAFRRKFLYAINQDDELDAKGLQSILEHKQSELRNLWCCSPGNEDGFKFKPLRLSVDTCKSAVAITDRDLNGRLNYDEFTHLLHLLMHWQEIYHKMAHGNGDMETYSLRNALKMAGFTVSNKTLEALVIRFANKGAITLESYVNALVKLSVAHQRRQNLPKDTSQDQSGFLQELLRTAIYS
ncbi:calpain-2 catalytic subunit-like [Mizuhopecten yessoensis]|uniref:Calpain-11 n=1 Tax=Mizuhopecten yessoensis TaxID=6573 RepID=A0A210QPN2_MIZYE|nr:calpain-2 catalytic subunit-like [Mizuhopecten yessoensis]OWF50689.1 Calpain-11 [Mizuhopecten yessoensis]